MERLIYLGYIVILAIIGSERKNRDTSGLNYGFIHSFIMLKLCFWWGKREIQMIVVSI